jgi:hypothetical protein
VGRVAAGRGGGVGGERGAGAGGAQLPRGLLHRVGDDRGIDHVQLPAGQRRPHPGQPAQLTREEQPAAGGDNRDAANAVEKPSLWKPASDSYAPSIGLL